MWLDEVLAQIQIIYGTEDTNHFTWIKGWLLAKKVSTWKIVHKVLCLSKDELMSFNNSIITININLLQKIYETQGKFCKTTAFYGHWIGSIKKSLIFDNLLKKS